MFKAYLILLLLAHVLGDFYIQTGKMAKKKEKSIKWVLIHCLCYFGIISLISLPIMSWKIALGLTVASVLHCLIDIAKYIYIYYINKKNRMTQIVERNVFFIDQLVHSICLIGIAYWLVQSNVQINEWKNVNEFFNIIGVSQKAFVSWIFALLVIHKPTNIAISKLLIIYKPKNKEQDDGIKDNNTGRFIGTVEKIIMLIFLAIRQYSAIGLVLTAKSIARYDRISKEKDFAEYYLLGTLISTVAVIIISFILL